MQVLQDSLRLTPPIREGQMVVVLLGVHMFLGSSSCNSNRSMAAASCAGTGQCVSYCIYQPILSMLTGAMCCSNGLWQQDDSGNHREKSIICNSRHAASPSPGSLAFASGQLGLRCAAHVHCALQSVYGTVACKSSMLASFHHCLAICASTSTGMVRQSQYVVQHIGL